MITTETTVSFDDSALRMLNVNPEQALFFDIETTGFRASVSHLYLIGAAWKSPDEPGKWVIRQMLSEYPQSEAALL